MSITAQPDAAPPRAEVTPSPAGSARLMWAILSVVLLADLLDLLDASAAWTAPQAASAPWPPIRA